MTCLLTDQNLWTIFEKGHPRNISVKLFQNLTSGFREEDFLRISSFPYSESSPHSLEPCLKTDQNFPNNFWERLIQGTFLWNYFKIWPAAFGEDFFRNSSCQYSAKKTPFTRAMFMDGSKFCEQFLKRVTQGTFLWNYFKIGSAVP